MSDNKENSEALNEKDLLEALNNLKGLANSEADREEIKRIQKIYEERYWQIEESQQPSLLAIEDLGTKRNFAAAILADLLGMVIRLRAELSLLRSKTADEDLKALLGAIIVVIDAEYLVGKMNMVHQGALFCYVPV